MSKDKVEVHFPDGDVVCLDAIVMVGLKKKEEEVVTSKYCSCSSISGKENLFLIQMINSLSSSLAEDHYNQLKGSDKND